MAPEANPADNLRSQAQELDFVRRVRRSLHRHPELGHHEYRTSNYVERMLRTMGLQPFRPAPTSVAVLIGPRHKRPSVGFRTDLDAIPVHESTDSDYASRNPGVMHACGHDGHIAALLALAKRLSTNPPAGAPVLLIFQQAEETFPSGAPVVIEGLPNTLVPEEIFAFHLWPELPSHTVGIKAGTLTSILQWPLWLE